MLTTSDFCKKEYGEKLYKISFDAGFTCPNRDGFLGNNGCIFCSFGGSGEFAVKLNTSNDIEADIQKAKDMVSKKYKGSKYIAYFQAFTNTYADVETLRNIYMPIIKRNDIAVLSIATRPDCISEETYTLLKELNSIKPVWVELGLQTTNLDSVKYIRRGYENKVYDTAVKRLNSLGIHTITHVILYLPGETVEDMHNTVNYVVKAGSCGIKFSLLYVLRGTDLGKDYTEHPFHIPSLEEYANTLKSCIELCPSDMIIHRITGDAPRTGLIEPKWSRNKKNVLNTLNDTLTPPQNYYVYMLKCGDGSFYTGSTNNVLHRLSMHSQSKGCHYTTSHQPVELIYVENCHGKRAALRREYAIKQLSKKEKITLLNSKDNIVNDFTE